MASTPAYKDDHGRSCVPNIIDGEAVLLPPAASFPVTSADLGKIVHYAQSASVDIAIAAVHSATLAFKTYKTTRVDERRRLLLRTAELFEANAAEAVMRQTYETSCDKLWAQLNVTWVTETLRELAGSMATAVVGALPPSAHGCTTLVYKQPVGTVMIIPPWNAALALCVRGIASALAAGCTVVLKASELCPWTHQLILETFHAAGFPSSAINMIIADRPNGPQITETVISQPAIRKIEFIGSASVGRIIGSLCGKYLKPVLMELGDQSPAIVLDDSDLQRAAKLCAQGAMLHHGQVCFSTERVIVQSGVKEKFEKLLIAAVSEFTSAGTAVTIYGAQKAKDVIDDAVRDGARFLVGSSELHGASVKPSILTDVNRNSTIAASEAFAPTITVVSVDSDTAAIEEANSRSGGLSASVFTTSYERGLRMAQELDFGQVQINNMTMFSEPGGPTTCTKGSGWGSNAGRYGIEEYLFNKAVSLYPTDATPHH